MQAGMVFGRIYTSKAVKGLINRKIFFAWVNPVKLFINFKRK